MKIIIVGIGKFGKEIAKHLSHENHDIIVIDPVSENINDVVDQYDVLGYVGNGASLDVLEEAGCKDSDVLIATTANDETNIISCLAAKQLGVKKTIARIRNTEYQRQLTLKSKEFGIDTFINPDEATTSEILRILRFPSAIKVETFADDLVDLVEFKIEKDSLLNGIRLCDIKNKFNVSLLVCAVSREKEVMIPKGDFTLKEGDYAYVTLSSEEMSESFRKLHLFQKKLSSAFIIGGGRTSLLLAGVLLKQGFSLKIFDKDEAVCDRFAQALPSVSVIHADATNQKILLQEGVEDVDALVSLTDSDETNILLSAYAKSVGVDKVITKITNLNYDLIINNLGLDSILSPNSIFASNILRHVRGLDPENTSGYVFRNLYRLLNDRVEASEFYISSATDFTDTPLKDLKIKHNYLLASIIRNEEVITPSGKDVIKVGDSIVIISKDGAISDPSDILG